MLKLSGRYKIGFTYILVAVNIALILVLAFFTVKNDPGLDNFDGIAGQDVYQAVFLDNDQIYFGHLKKLDPTYARLTDVYYVKINENGNGELLKLGRFEPHAPQDEMIINQKHILFWENLKPDSPVIQKIRTMKLQEK